MLLVLLLEKRARGIYQPAAAFQQFACLQKQLALEFNGIVYKLSRKSRFAIRTVRTERAASGTWGVQQDPVEFQKIVKLPRIRIQYIDALASQPLHVAAQTFAPDAVRLARGDH